MNKINEIEFEILKTSSLGERLRFFRERMQELYGKRAYSTKSLGDLLEVSPQSLTAIERGISQNPSFHLMQKIALEFSIPLESFSDEYYQNGYRELYIGYPLPNEYTSKSTSLVRESFDGAKLGCIVYQMRSDNTMRLIYTKTTNRTFKDFDFIKSLSRFVNEMDLIDQDSPSFELKKIAPLEFSFELFKVLNNNPEKYPFVPKKEWDKAIENLFEINKGVE
ncbi:helix-turn-helix transcriptional regulator [Rossellomorea vietnamensis]|uniref:helix-turn-helix transcriptional regulator n=1 Tax=Rossellomorea vietnamensis TaxID=218284 RepID=UPI003CF63D61